MEIIKKQAVTLIELIIVVIIIGILASIALPEYTRSRERAIDKEAQAILIQIRAAERQYRMETGNYTSGTIIGAENINSNLSLDINSNNWNPYVIQAMEGFRARLYRTTVGGYNRYWQINSTETNASCFGVSGGICP